MKPATHPSLLDQCLHISAVHARLQLALDEELGTFHGLSYADFLLLRHLIRAQDQRVPMAQLATGLGLRLSALLRQILPLEKTGWVERDGQAGQPGQRHVQLRPAARQVVTNATETAQAVCERLAPSLGALVAVAVSDQQA